MLLAGGHSAQHERERRGYRWLWAGIQQAPNASSTFRFRDLSWHAPYSAFGLRLSGSNNAEIVPGAKGYLEVPFDCRIMEVSVIGNAVGSIVFDITRSTFAAFPPTQSIIGLVVSRPQLAAEQVRRDCALLGWSTLLAKGEVLGFSCLSISGLKTVALTMMVARNSQN